MDQTDNLEYEIIVVDNNSPDDADGTKALSENPNVRFFQAPENLGFGRANNMAASSANGRYLFFLNPDTILVNNAITEMVSFLENNSAVGACGGNLYDADHCPTHSFSRLFPSITKELDLASRRIISRLLFGRSHEFNYSSHPIEVAYITGADLMIPAKVWNEVGEFSDDFFMYYEETELEYRIRKAGYKVYSIPTAKIIHLEGKSFGLNVEREKRILRGRFVFFNKIYGSFYNTIANRMNLTLYGLGSFLCRLTGNKEDYEKYSTRKGLYREEMRRWS